MGVTTAAEVTHFTYIEGDNLGGGPLFRCETCKQIMSKGIVLHAEKDHGADQVVVDTYTTLEEHQARAIMEEVKNTSLTYLLIEATDRDEIPAYECAECHEKLIALSLAAHLRVHSAKTYKIDTKRLDNPLLAAIDEHFERLRQLVTQNYLNSRERSLTLTKLEEAQLWLTRCQEVEHPGYLVQAALDEVAP
jgi:hypothetical protein